jgi:hypothetical protein
VHGSLGGLLCARISWRFAACTDLLGVCCVHGSLGGLLCTRISWRFAVYTDLLRLVAPVREGVRAWAWTRSDPPRALRLLPLQHDHVVRLPGVPAAPPPPRAPAAALRSHVQSLNRARPRSRPGASLVHVNDARLRDHDPQAGGVSRDGPRRVVHLWAGALVDLLPGPALFYEVSLGGGQIKKVLMS